MNVAVQNLPHDLEAYVGTYAHDAQRFAPVKNRILEKIRNYDSPYGTGEIIFKHLQRVSRESENFLLHEGYEPRVAHIIAEAFILHDAGKTLQPPALWRVTTEKPSRTAEEKAEREKHAALGVDVLRETIDELGFEPSVDDARHIFLIEHLMQRHHDRRPQPMDNVMSMFTIIDQIDGKGKAKDLQASFTDMSGAKHGEQFDQYYVGRYRLFCEKENRLTVQDAPPTQPKLER